MPETAQFVTWPLHDALLADIRFDWSAREVSVKLQAFLNPGEFARPAELRFHRVAELLVPNRMPWGESLHVNAQRVEAGSYILEMQSGDEIRIIAENAELVPVSESGPT